GRSWRAPTSGFVGDARLSEPSFGCAIESLGPPHEGRVPRRLEGRVKPENRLRLRGPRNGGPLVFSGVQSFLWTFHRETKHSGSRHPSRCSGPWLQVQRFSCPATSSRPR